MFGQNVGNLHQQPNKIHIRPACEHSVFASIFTLSNLIRRKLGRQMYQYAVIELPVQKGLFVIDCVRLLSQFLIVVCFCFF
jgi:hypothetical protein